MISWNVRMRMTVITSSYICLKWSAKRRVLLGGLHVEQLHPLSASLLLSTPSDSVTSHAALQRSPSVDGDTKQECRARCQKHRWQPMEVHAMAAE